MKYIIKNYLITSLMILFLAFFSSLILAFMDQMNVFSYQTLMILNYSLSYTMFAIVSYILGVKSKKHGLIHGIVFSLLFFIVSDFSSIYTILRIVMRTFIIIFFTILGVNKKNSS